jgi:hypothetical protein
MAEEQGPASDPVFSSAAWRKYLVDHPGSHVPLMVLIALLTLVLTPLIAYGCWVALLLPLWQWGFTPPSWRAVPALLGALYLVMIPLAPPVLGVQGIGLVMSAHVAVRDHAARRQAAGIVGKGRLALLVFGMLPLILAVVALAIYGTVALNLATLRWIFLAVAVLFPATLYYLFNVSRRYSILTDLIANLDRAGLLTPATATSREQSRQKRVVTYIRKYESTYGPLGPRALTDIQTAASLERAVEAVEEIRDESRPFSAVMNETRIPVVIATVLIAVGWAVALPPMVQANDWEAQFSPTLGTISFAFLGAYFFSVQMLLRRYIRRDLSSTAFTSVSLRIILAVIGTWVVMYGVDGIAGQRLTEQGRLVLAFSIGLLPVIVIQALAEVSKKLFAWAHVMESLRNSYPTSRLDGLSVWHASRLEEEDLDNVHGMATADILELMIQTRLPPDRIVEWVDQAILYSQLADAQPSGDTILTDKLKQHGVRSATTLLVAQDQEPGKLGDLFSPKELACLGLAARAMRTKPNLELILRWRGIDPNHFPVLEPTPLPMGFPGHSGVS